ncbi:MAG: polyphosphate kinase 2 family protein [Planctomycetota bacterium]
MSRSFVVKPGTRVSLAEWDPDDTADCPTEAHAEHRLAQLRAEMAELQGLLYADNRYALLVLLQGIDASGKDGTIRHVMSGLSPLGCHVTPFKQPSEEELDHDFLWRVHHVMPRRGEIAIFNRSHYEDVLIVRVHDLVPKKDWKRRYKHINLFERVLVENGTVILKFFLHISKDEQKRRFEERLANPKKYWKFAASDVAERKLWDDYMRAYEAALSKCSTPWARWTIVPANKKWVRNLVVAETIEGLARARHALPGCHLRSPRHRHRGASARIGGCLAPRGACTTRKLGLALEVRAISMTSATACPVPLVGADLRRVDCRLHLGADPRRLRRRRRCCRSQPATGFAG